MPSTFCGLPGDHLHWSLDFSYGAATNLSPLEESVAKVEGTKREPIRDDAGRSDVDQILKGFVDTLWALS